MTDQATHDALASAFTDHGVALVQHADDEDKRNQDRLRDLATAILLLLLGTDFADPVSVRATAATMQELIASTYESIAAACASDSRELAQIEADFAVACVNSILKQRKLRPVTTSLTDLILQGHSAQAWWQAQAEDLTAKLAQILHTGAQARLPLDDLSAAVQSALAKSATHAQTLTHSIVQRTSMDARRAVFKANDTFGVQVIATLDTHTCAQCLAYHGSTYDSDGNPTGNTILPFNGGPEFHMNCRCALVPLFDAEDVRPLDASRWLERKTPKQQDDLLGKGRAALYREGKITLRDLVSGTGQQLSLAQLKTKYD